MVQFAEPESQQLQAQEDSEEEEKKELEAEPVPATTSNEDWQASVRGFVPSDDKDGKSKRRRGNRGSLDGTRRFRKVVTFRKSLVQTREIAGRKQRRFTGWFTSSKNAQQHTQETLEEQKAAKLQAKKEKKEKKEAKKMAKKEKKEAKAAKKAAKAEAKRNQGQSSGLSNNIGSGSIPLVFEDSNLDSHMDSMSLNINTGMGNSSNMNMGNSSNSNNNNMARENRRRRSSVSALLGLFHKPKFPRNTPRRAHTHPGQQPHCKNDEDDDCYDWSAHLRESQNSSVSKQQRKSHSTSLLNQQPLQDEIEREEEQLEQEMLALPKTNNLHANSFVQDSPFNTASVQSFADPNAPDNIPQPRRAGRKKSIFQSMFGSNSSTTTKEKKAPPKRKPTPKRLTTSNTPGENGSSAMMQTSNASANLGSSISGPFAKIVALDSTAK